jgi:hypothetical protein
MNISYVIQWKSKSNGRAGRGTKRFDREEAERLAEELNREYPQIDHQAVEAPADGIEHPGEPTPQEAPATPTVMLSMV